MKTMKLIRFIAAIERLAVIVTMAASMQPIE